MNQHRDSLETIQWVLDKTGGYTYTNSQGIPYFICMKDGMYWSGLKTSTLAELLDLLDGKELS